MRTCLVWLAVRAALLLVLCACSGSSASEPAANAPPPTELGGSRPATISVPDGYTPAKAYPLLVMLHGYMTSGLLEEAYQRLEAPAMARGYLYIHPDGTFDPSGARFWNDWPGGHGGSSVDDVGYVGNLIDEIRAAYHVDDARIFVTGHSNGGSMSYRLACERSGRIAAIAVLAGSMPVGVESICKPTAAMNVLHVHGTEDKAVLYAGSTANLGAEACVAFWRKRAGCTASAAGEPLDLDNNLAGAETTVARDTGCTGGSAELWTIAGAPHVPAFGTAWGEKLLDFFDAHGKK